MHYPGTTNSIVHICCMQGSAAQKARERFQHHIHDLKGITLGENFSESTHRVIDTSKFVLARRFDLYPKVVLKGFESITFM